MLVDLNFMVIFTPQHNHRMKHDRFRTDIELKSVDGMPSEILIEGANKKQRTSCVYNNVKDMIGDSGEEIMTCWDEKAPPQGQISLRPPLALHIRSGERLILLHPTKIVHGGLAMNNTLVHFFKPICFKYQHNITVINQSKNL
jgi:hypothetical protein